MARSIVTRAFFIPKDAEKIEDLESGAVAYLSVHRNGNWAMGFGGKRQRPDFNYTFPTEEYARKYIQKYFDGQRASVKAKAERRAEQKAFKTTLKVGSILYTSWGYDQTNIDWYQVIEVKPSGKTVVIREIGYDKVETTGWMCGYCTPKKNAFKGEPMTKRVREGDALTMTSYSSAFPWDGKKKYWSSYA